MTHNTMTTAYGDIQLITPKRGPIDEVYVGGFNSQKVVIYARSEAEAKQRAIEYFRPKKTHRSRIWVKPLNEEELI